MFSTTRNAFWLPSSLRHEFVYLSPARRACHTGINARYDAGVCLDADNDELNAIIQRNGAACQILCGVTETYVASSAVCAVEPGPREHKLYSRGPGSHGTD